MKNGGRMRNTVLAILSAAIFTCAFSEQTIIGKMGTLEFGGSGGLSLGFPDDEYYESYFTISIAPILNYFPINGLYIGPIVSFGYSQTSLDNGDKSRLSSGLMGGKIGFVLDLNLSVLPYGEAGAAVNFSNITHYYASLDTTETLTSNIGFCIPLTGGIKIPVASQMTINLDGTVQLKIGDVDPGIDFQFGFGLTGHVPMRF
jgi:hypothetical protein